MKEITNMERSMAQVHSNGLTTRNTLVSSTTITFTAREFILGVMAGGMKVNGRTIRCTEKVHSLGLMGGNMWESTVMIKSKAMESSFGLMAGPIREIGTMGNNMEKVSMLLHKVLKSMESGRRERELDGLGETITNDNKHL